MSFIERLRWTAVGLGLAFAAVGGSDVTIERLPDGALQPQVVTLGKVVHLVYYQGKPQQGNLFYSMIRDGKRAAPVRVNSQDNSAVAIGTIRGGQLAVGPDGVVHVVWNGSKVAQPRGLKNPFTKKENAHGSSPLLYGRLESGASAFTAQRNLMTKTYALDGGGAVAAGKDGVYVVWHAAHDGGGAGEQGRGVFVARSTDGGKSFAPERDVLPEETGACGCCGLAAGLDTRGNLHILYRTANQMVNRNMMLLTGQGERFRARVIDRWRINRCVMSLPSFAADGGWMAWEGEAGVAAADLQGPQMIRSESKLGRSAEQKYPVVATFANGDILLAWVAGAGWNRGGRLQWQRFSPDGNKVSSGGGAKVPTWSYAAAYPNEDGGVTLLY